MKHKIVSTMNRFSGRVFCVSYQSDRQSACRFAVEMKASVLSERKLEQATTLVVRNCRQRVPWDTQSLCVS